MVIEIHHDTSWCHFLINLFFCIMIHHVQSMVKQVILSWCITIHYNINSYWYAPTQMREACSDTWWQKNELHIKPLLQLLMTLLQCNFAKLVFVQCFAISCNPGEYVTFACSSSHMITQEWCSSHNHISTHDMQSNQAVKNCIMEQSLAAFRMCRQNSKLLCLKAI